MTRNPTATLMASRPLPGRTGHLSHRYAQLIGQLGKISGVLAVGKARSR
jgi:hypothetical protein